MSKVRSACDSVRHGHDGALKSLQSKVVSLFRSFIQSSCDVLAVAQKEYRSAMRTDPRLALLLKETERAMRQSIQRDARARLEVGVKMATNLHSLSVELHEIDEQAQATHNAVVKAVAANATRALQTVAREAARQ